MNLQELTQLYNFSGRVVAITGGAGLIGGEIACALVGLGAHVAILDRNSEMAKQVVQRMGCDPGCAIVVYADVLKRDSLEEASARIREALGPVDTLINAAGGNHPDATTNPDRSFFSLADEALRATFDLNILGTVLPCQVFGQGMAEAGKGTILNISSMAAISPLSRIPAYSAAKAGVSNFTQWLAVHMAQEYSPHIRVNAIAPGFLLSEQNRFLLWDEAAGDYTKRGKQVIDHTPMGRFGTAEDLLGAVLWLISDAASFVTGIVVPIDGGFSAYSGV
ncbi:MAG: SDR family oxidoreductase [Anaerolineae bacterium]